MKRRDFLLSLSLPFVAAITGTVAAAQTKTSVPTVYEGNVQSHIFLMIKNMSIREMTK